MIQHYKNNHKEALISLLNGYPMNWGDRASITLINIDGDKITGVGSLSKNQLHPSREYINIYIHPQERQEGIGESIFKDLLSLSKTKKFQVAISSKNTAAVSFLEKGGFLLARKCYTPQLINTSSQAGKKLINYQTLNNLSFNQKEEVFNLQLKNYQAFHKAINPLSDKISLDQWKEIILEDLVEAHSYILVSEGNSEAYVLCYESEDKSSIEIGYVGGKDTSKLDKYLVFYRQALNQLLADFSKVEIEADNVDPFAFALLNEFEYDKSDSWDTYIFNGN